MAELNQAQSQVIRRVSAVLIDRGFTVEVKYNQSDHRSIIQDNFMKIVKGIPFS